MDIGMLWYDDDAKRRLDEKVARAVAHYRTKYGVTPNLCFVNPSMLQDGPAMTAGVQLRPAQTVMINHFWLGVSEAGTPAETKGRSGARKKKAN